MLTKECTIALKDIDSKSGIVEGYLSAFGNIDSDGDMIQNGAFAKTIAERGPSGKNRIKHLRNHNPDHLIGKFLELREDERGLYFRSQMSKSTAGRDMLCLYEEGIVTEHSIGFQIMAYRKESGEDEKEYTVLTDLKLWEGSAVTWGANSETPITGIKSIGELNLEIERIDRALSIGALSDEKIMKLMNKYSQLIELLQSHKSRQTHSEEEEKTAKEILTAFKTTFKS